MGASEFTEDAIDAIIAQAVQMKSGARPSSLVGGRSKARYELPERAQRSAVSSLPNRWRVAITGWAIPRDRVRKSPADDWGE